jgi:hypothetical protein
MTEKNMWPLLGKVLSSTTFGPTRVTFISQFSCTPSSFRDPDEPNKPIFLKDLTTLVEMGEVKSVQDVLLVDDSPVKNLLNDVNSAVHPTTWSGQVGDNFLPATLRPWLDGLFLSNEAVPDYVKANPLLGCQNPVDRLDSLGINILKGVIPKT